MNGSAEGAPEKLEGTFLQLNPGNLARTEAQWKKEFDAVKAIGMDTLIIQFCGANGKAYYPSTAFETAAGAEGDPVRMILRQAARMRMKVFLGLYSDWGSADEMASRNIRMAEDLLKRYGRFKSFVGWYIPQEASNAPAIDSPVVEAFQRTAAWCREKTPGKPVGIAPYFGLHDPEAFYRAWAAILKKIEIHILMLQDGVGCDRHLDTKNIVPYLEAMARACRENKVRFWSDLETFRIPRNWRPAPVEELLEQIRVESPFVEKIVIFEFHHHMNPESSELHRQLYEGYADHLRKMKGTKSPVTGGKR
ncbi:MAG: DUF4434 domain-containing protein [Armatimonadetes bacterium]|nr:DUF4434 domain-containing protein [Armatimonadota bacterium]